MTTHASAWSATQDVAAITAVSTQRCAICGGPTVRREILPGEWSNFCPACSTPTRHVFTADSDGHEAERRERIREILRGMAWDVVRRRRAAATHLHST